MSAQPSRVSRSRGSAEEQADFSVMKGVAIATVWLGAAAIAWAASSTPGVIPAIVDVAALITAMLSTKYIATGQAFY